MSKGVAHGSNPRQPKIFGRENINYQGPEKANEDSTTDGSLSGVTRDFNGTGSDLPDPVLLTDFSTRYLENQDVDLTYSRYQDGSIALILTDTDTGEPLATATRALPNIQPMSGNVFIANYSENEGMLNELQEHGIIGEQIREIPTGYTTVYECPLLDADNSDSGMTKKSEPLFPHIRSDADIFYPQTIDFTTQPILDETEFTDDDPESPHYGEVNEYEYKLACESEIDFTRSDIQDMVSEWSEVLDDDVSHVMIYGQHLGWTGTKGYKLVELDDLQSDPVTSIMPWTSDVSQSWDLNKVGDLIARQSHHDAQSEIYHFVPLTTEEVKRFKEDEWTPPTPPGWDE